MMDLPRAKLLPGKSYSPGVFNDTGTMHKTVVRRNVAVHGLECHKYLYNPLALLRLIEKTVLAQTEDQYPFATIYDQ